ncbi:hypothetical protein CLU79DRAFT_375628 [Phycomyces nitens]|nr:hypothetical protein CLU79DRAFT_375628 [Phycomyces nitens]
MIPLESSQSESIISEETLSESVSSENTPYKPVNYQQPQSQKHSNENTMILDDIDMDQPQGDYFVCDGFDVTNAIYRLKISIKDYPWKLSLEDNLHLILASTSVLLLTPETFPNEIQPFFY